MRRFLIPFLLLAVLVAARPALAITTTTTNLCLNKPAPGDPASQNTWGTLLNTNSNISDGYTAGVVSISVAGASNVVLTFNCGSVDQTDSAHFTFTGVLTGNIYVLWPNSRSRMFSVTNSTTGAFTLSLGANSGGSPAGATVTVPQGYTGSYYSSGINVYSRVQSGGITMAANSVVANIQGSSGTGIDAPLPTCSGGLTYAPGSGFGCNAGGGGGGGGTALAWGGTHTTSFAAVANTIYCIDTVTSGPLTMTLPATPVVGNQIVFLDCNSSFATNTFTVANNGNLLMGFNQNMTVGVANAGSTLNYTGVTLGWRMY